MAVIGVDLGHSTVLEAEHWLADLSPAPGLIACTHFAAGRFLISVTGIAVGDLPPRSTPPVPHDGAALAAAADHSARRGGRAVIYPGVTHLTGTMTVADLLDRSAIEAVHVIGDADAAAAPQTLVDTGGFVRPQWMDGRLTLVAMPAPGGRIVPFDAATRRPSAVSGRPHPTTPQ
jgi:hypothetical protein